jgi:hypothetical protein
VDRGNLAVAYDKAIWVFGYGSLLWDRSNITVTEERVGRLYGWHRDWTYISEKRRHGAPTCNLQPGGSVKGKFLRLHPATQENDLKALRKREGPTERISHPKNLRGEVHYWTMGRNLEKFYDTKGVTGREIYRLIARIAKGILAKGPGGKSAEEYAMAVHEFDPMNWITQTYVNELRNLRLRNPEKRRALTD